MKPRFKVGELIKDGYSGHRFKPGDLVLVIAGRHSLKDVYDPLLLVSFHTAKCWSINYPCPASELKDYWTVLVVDELQRRDADYINECCKKLNEI